MVSYALTLHNRGSLHATIGRIIGARNDSVNEMLGGLHSVSFSQESIYVGLYHFVSLKVSLEIRFAVETISA